MLRLCLLVAAAVMLCGFGDAELPAPIGDASGRGVSSISNEQADSSRMLLQAQQDDIVGTASKYLISGVRPEPRNYQMDSDMKPK